MTSVAHPGLTVCDPKLIVGPIQHGGHSGGKILLISLHAYSLGLTNGEAQKFYCGFLQDLGEFIRCSWESSHVLSAKNHFCVTFVDPFHLSPLQFHH